MLSTRLALAAAWLALAAPALAYRPFDSTDADVARAGEFELELGPVGRLREGARKVLIAPAVVANIGLQGDREIVLQGQREKPLDAGEGDPRSVLSDAGAFVKQVLRRGALQDAQGPSVATEYGVLLPSVPGGHGTGFSIAGIVSERSEAGALHLNAALARTREHEPDLFLGAIVEGPGRWPLRPVAELLQEHAQGSPSIRSRLLGAIWRLREDLSLDVGVRAAQAGPELIRELRLGLTWSFPLAL